MSWGRLFSTAPTDLLPLFAPRPQAQTTKNRGGYLEWFKASIPATWELPPHVRLIAESLDDLDAGVIDRLAISMPPRHGKSETITCRYPLSWMLENPGENVLVTGYNERFARKFGRRIRNAAKESGIVADDKSAADEWATIDGGLCMTRGVGSPPTGTGFGRIVIDDPIRSREDADSLVFRDKAWDWYSEDIYSRLEPGGGIVMIGTRWHEDDVIARAIASEPDRWRVVNIPALADENDPLGRKPGEALWPSRYSVEALERIRAINPRAFGALYQGRPTAREGDFFKVSSIRFVSETDIPTSGESAVALDLGYSESGDYTALAQCWRLPDNRFLIDVGRIRASLDKRNVWIEQQVRRRSAPTYIPQDGGAGKDTVTALSRLLAGVPVYSSPVRGSKELRAEPFASQVSAGNVLLVDSPDARVALEEMRSFPHGKHDDLIDAMSDAFKAIAKPKYTYEVF